MAGLKDVFISDENEVKMPTQGNFPTRRKGLEEPLKPAIRPSFPSRRASSMPGTSTFSKAVKFDLDLEHVRYFLQADKPLAVSAGSPPVEVYNSDSEFLFGRINSGRRNHPFEWELVMSNFPEETPARLLLPVRVERVSVLSDNSTLVGSVAVANLAFNKYVAVRFTFDNWKTTSEVVADFNYNVCQPKHTDGYDRFNFSVRLADQTNLEVKTMFFCVRYLVNGLEYWDNNNSANFQVSFRKKLKQQNGNGGNGTQGAFGNPTQIFSNSSGPIFNNRYDFSSTLPAAIKAGSFAVRHRSSPITEPTVTKTASGSVADAIDMSFFLTMGNRSLSDAKALYKAVPAVMPSRTRAEPPHQDTNTNHFLASQLYNELLEKYCFFGSTESPQMPNNKTLQSC